MIDKGSPIDTPVLRPAKDCVDMLRSQPGDQRTLGCGVGFSEAYGLPDLFQCFGLLLQLLCIPGKTLVQRLSAERLAEPAGLKRSSDPLPGIVQCPVQKVVIGFAVPDTLYLVDADIVKLQ